MANEAPPAQALGASGSLAIDMSAAKLNSMVDRARDAATTIQNLTGKYPWEIIPECPDTSWSANLLETFRPFIKKCLKQSGDTNKVLDDIREFLVKEAQGHRGADRTKLNVNDIKKARLHFCRDLEKDSRPKVEGNHNPKRGVSEIASMPQLESPINKWPNGGQNERGSQNANDTLDFNVDKPLDENLDQHEHVEFFDNMSSPWQLPCSFIEEPALDSKIDPALQLDQQAYYICTESDQQTASNKFLSVEQATDGTTTMATPLSDPNPTSHDHTIPRMSTWQLETNRSSSAIVEHAREAVEQLLEEVADANTCHGQVEEKLNELQSRVVVFNNQLGQLQKEIGNATKTKAEAAAKSKALEDKIGSLKQMLSHM
ncbi:hypothetical protein BHE90_014504 [Fusarium euwallaceae]|uniref:Uncharacterized protein n=1 Tax=Fusarium euwallaceae TaxID=1147111 RepID=A0A430L5S0_9HYPO|nr:hypothetical protein BHE90_014504 [Fusarium euwallaceae]